MLFTQSSHSKADLRGAVKRWAEPQLICINEIDLAHRRGQTIL